MNVVIKRKVNGSIVDTHPATNASVVYVETDKNTTATLQDVINSMQAEIRALKAELNNYVYTVNTDILTIDDGSENDISLR